MSRTPTTPGDATPAGAAPAGAAPAGSASPDAAAADAALLIARTFDEQGLDWQRLDDRTFAVALPGEKRLKTACVLTIGRHALSIEAFVVRAPDENREQVYSWLLQRNARLYGVSWSIDRTGDIYLTGRVPLAGLSADELDRLLGCVLEYSDGSFNVLLEMGFGSSIRREWAWRVKNGLPRTNLAAFADFAQRAD